MEIQAEINADGKLFVPFPKGISMNQLMNATLTTNILINGDQSFQDSLQDIRLEDLIDFNKSSISMSSDDNSHTEPDYDE